jgi:hypothetical protein
VPAKDANGNTIPGVDRYVNHLVPDIGDALLSDYFVFYFFDGTPGAFNLEGDDANYATCLHCVMAQVDRTDAGATNRYFLARSGTLTVSDDSTPLTGLLDAVATDVTLEEVTIDDTTYVSTPVQGGACLHFSSLHVLYPPS